MRPGSGARRKHFKIFDTCIYHSRVYSVKLFIASISIGCNKERNISRQSQYRLACKLESSVRGPTAQQRNPYVIYLDLILLMFQYHLYIVRKYCI